MALGMPMAGDPRAGSAAQIAAKARPRRDHVYVEMRRCHHCQQQGHLRQVCPTAKQDKHGADDEEADNTRRLSADPLPIRHGDREVHWQGEVPVHPHQEASQEDELLDFDIDVRSDSTCRDNDACLCHWCKRSKLRLRGIRPSLRQRADDVGLDTDEPGWVCDLRAMGEISDGEWAELYGDKPVESHRDWFAISVSGKPSVVLVGKHSLAAAGAASTPAAKDPHEGSTQPAGR